MSTTAQQAFILCTPDRTLLQTFMDDLLRELAEQAATVLLYGVTSKRREGFVVVEAAKGIPATVRQWLASHPDVLESVICDVPSLAQEREIEAEARSLQVPPELSPAVHLALLVLEQHYRLLPDNETGGLRLVPAQKESRTQNTESTEPQETIGPPHMPEGYTPIGQPVPLLTEWDSRWIVRAIGTGDEGEGILIFEDQCCVAFLVADEALSALSLLMQEALTLQGAPELNHRHAETLSRLRSLWWMEETRKARALLQTRPVEEQS